MPWKDIGQQPTLQWISIGKDIDGDLYSKKEIRAVIEMVINKDSQPIKLLSYSLRQMPPRAIWLGNKDVVKLLRANGATERKYMYPSGGMSCLIRTRKRKMLRGVTTT
jgi:hypothetical protein